MLLQWQRSAKHGCVSKYFDALVLVEGSLVVSAVEV